MSTYNMDGYDNYNSNYYPGTNDPDPLPADADGDLNDDFDPLELLQSPLFDNKARTPSDDGLDGDDYGGYAEQRQQRTSLQQQQQQQQGMPLSASVTPGSSSNSSSSPPFSGYGAQALPSGSGGFSSQFGGMGQPPSMIMSGNNSNSNNMNLNMNNNSNNMNNSSNRMSSPQLGGGMPTGGGGGGMPQNMNLNAMNMNMNMNNNFGMPQGGSVGTCTNPAMMGSGAGVNPMQGGSMGMNMNNMNMNMNAAALQHQMGQMQAMQMQAAMMGNPMSAASMSAAGNPMMNPMQMGNNQQFQGANNNLSNSNMMGPMGAMPNNNNMSMSGGMNGMTVNRNGSLNNALPNLNGMNVNHPNNSNAMSLHGSLPNIQGPSFVGSQGGGPMRGGSVPTSPNIVPSVAQMSASIQMRNSSSRSGARTRGPTPMVDVNGKVIANTSADPGINEAMEKLCESMRRSAMSRNLVKQLSGRSVQRQGSSRSLSRSNSGLGIRKQMSGRSLSGNLAMGADNDGSGRGGTPTRVVPVRRLSGAKHRIHQRAVPNVRVGPFRQNSMGSQQGNMGGQTYLQLDDQTLGAL